jgi:hypothetical protein
VIAFLRDKQQPVSCEELRQRFVGKLGFALSTVMAVSQADTVLHYLNGILVHADTIGWNAEKQAQLLGVANRYYHEQRQAGEVFARADLLLELHEDDLPRLDHGIDWTGLLIGELLSAELGVRVFGNRRNALVLDADERALTSFSAFVALILRTYFQGAASMKDLSEFLRDKGVIAKLVTPAMLDGSNDLVFDEREVTVREAR